LSVGISDGGGVITRREATVFDPFLNGVKGRHDHVPLVDCTGNYPRQNSATPVLRNFPANIVNPASTDGCSIDMALAAEGARLAAALRTPTLELLLYSAIHDTDLLGDLTDEPDVLRSVCENAVDAAADLWSDRHGDAPVALELIVAAREMLLVEAKDMLADRAKAAADALLDAIEAGDVDANGTAIPYPTYRRA
jgi:hypothetical protein